MTASFPESDSSFEARQVRFMGECILIPDEALKTARSLSTRSVSFSLSMPWSFSAQAHHWHSSYQLDCTAAQRAKDPTVTIKLPSITTRAARRASISHDKEYAHLRSCLRRPGSSPGPRPTFHPHGPATPPVLPPLVEDSPFVVPEEALITSPISEEPSPITPTPNPGESDERAPRSFARSRSLPASENGGIGAGAGGATLAATRSLSPSSYFNFSRRRGGSLSSSLAEADSTVTTLDSADPPHPPKPARSQSLGPSASASTHDIPSPPAASGSGTHYPLAHFHIPTIHAQSLSTVPLAPCCADCIATLDAHPSALLPLNSEDDAHWSKRAWEKRKADEAEEEAVRRSAGIAHGLDDAAVSPPAYQSTPASAPAVSPEEKKMMDHLESSPTTPSVRRTPLSPASIKRNQAFRNHFASKDSEVEECRGVKSEEEARRCLDVVDMGVKARVVPKREVKDDDEEEEEDEEEERESEAAPAHTSDSSDAKHKHDVENKTALALVGNPVVSLLPSFPSPSSSPTANTTSPSPAAAPSSPPEQAQTRGGFMTRLRSRSSSNPTPPTPAPSQSNVGPKGGIKTGGGETSGFNAFTALTRLSGVAS